MTRQEISEVLVEVIDAGDRLLKASKEMLKYAEILLDAVRTFREAIASGNEDAEEKAEAVSYTKEDVRGVLSEKSASGFRKEVRELLKKYDAAKLVELPEEHYADVIREAKEIGNE